MNQQPAAEETEMDTTENSTRLNAACDAVADVTAPGYDAGPQAELRMRLARASRPSRRIVELLPVD